MTKTYFRGRPCCPCMAVWLPVAEAELLRRGIIARALDIYQLDGSAPASAGTHRGGAADLAQATDEALYVYRQMGADAAWRRDQSQGFILHAHLVLRGCPHNTSARYQYTSPQVGVDHGRNGLTGRHAGPDDGPRPLSGRSWQEGIAWAVEQTPKELPARVVRTREQLKADIAETTAELNRTRKARTTARLKGERTEVYREAIAALKRIRTQQRLTRRRLAKAPKR